MVVDRSQCSELRWTAPAPPPAPSAAPARAGDAPGASAALPAGRLKSSSRRFSAPSNAIAPSTTGDCGHILPALGCLDHGCGPVRSSCSPGSVQRGRRERPRACCRSRQTRHLEGHDAKLVHALQADILYGVALGGEHQAHYTATDLATTVRVLHSGVAELVNRAAASSGQGAVNTEQQRGGGTEMWPWAGPPGELQHSASAHVASWRRHSWLPPPLPGFAWRERRAPPPSAAAAAGGAAPPRHRHRHRHRSRSPRSG